MKLVETRTSFRTITDEIRSTATLSSGCTCAYRDKEKNVWLRARREMRCQSMFNYGVFRASEYEVAASSASPNELRRRLFVARCASKRYDCNVRPIHVHSSFEYLTAESELSRNASFRLRFPALIGEIVNSGAIQWIEKGSDFGDIELLEPRRHSRSTRRRYI